MMEKFLLPSTPLSVSPLGLGLAALGRPGYINLGHGEDLEQQHSLEAMEVRTHEMLDAAWAAGIRYFDTARSYGKAEEFLGNWLRRRRIPEAGAVVGSKWGYTYTADWKVKAEAHEVKEHSLERLQQQLRESRRLLGSYLKLYQIHSATPDSGVLEKQEVLEELWRMKGEGMAIGLTLSGPLQARTLEKALRISQNGELLFNTVQASWNLLESSAEPMLKQAHERGMGIIVKEVLANGRLTDRNLEPAFTNKYKKLSHLADRKGCVPEAIAIAAALTKPWADVVLSGATTREQLDSSLQATRVVLSEYETEELRLMAEDSVKYWNKRSALEWN